MKQVTISTILNLSQTSLIVAPQVTGGGVPSVLLGSFRLWRYQYVGLLVPPAKNGSTAVDLMAGTGEVWPHLLRRFPCLGTITALDISHRMHLEAVGRLHGKYADRITHFEADALQTDLPTEHADLVISTFGLKTFDTRQ